MMQMCDLLNYKHLEEQGSKYGEIVHIHLYSKHSRALLQILKLLKKNIKQ